MFWLRKSKNIFKLLCPMYFVCHPWVTYRSLIIFRFTVHKGVVSWCLLIRRFPRMRGLSSSVDVFIRFFGLSPSYDFIPTSELISCIQHWKTYEYLPSSNFQWGLFFLFYPLGMYILFTQLMSLRIFCIEEDIYIGLNTYTKDSLELNSPFFKSSFD